MKYKCKNNGAVIDAMQYNHTRDIEKVTAWLNETSDIYEINITNIGLQIMDIAGTHAHYIQFGQVILKGKSGRLYICDGDILQTDFEEVKT